MWLRCILFSFCGLKVSDWLPFPMRLAIKHGLHNVIVHPAFWLLRTLRCRHWCNIYIYSIYTQYIYISQLLMEMCIKKKQKTKTFIFPHHASTCCCPVVFWTSTEGKAYWYHCQHLSSRIPLCTAYNEASVFFMQAQKSFYSQAFSLTEPFSNTRRSI